VAHVATTFITHCHATTHSVFSMPDGHEQSSVHTSELCTNCIGVPLVQLAQGVVTEDFMSLLLHVEPGHFPSRQLPAATVLLLQACPLWQSASGLAILADAVVQRQAVELAGLALYRPGAIAAAGYCSLTAACAAASPTPWYDVAVAAGARDFCCPCDTTTVPLPQVISCHHPPSRCYVADAIAVPLARVVD